MIWRHSIAKSCKSKHQSALVRLEGSAIAGEPLLTESASSCTGTARGSAAAGLAELLRSAIGMVAMFSHASSGTDVSKIPCVLSQFELVEVLLVQKCIRPPEVAL